MPAYTQHHLDEAMVVVFIIGVTGAIIFGRLAKRAWQVVS